MPLVGIIAKKRDIQAIKKELANMKWRLYILIKKL